MPLFSRERRLELLIDQAEHVGFNRYTVLNLHALLAENHLADSAAWGRLRAATVDIGGSTYHPLAVPQLIEECFEQILHKADASTIRSSKLSSPWCNFPICSGFWT